MKQVRVTGVPDQSVTPPVFTTLADSPVVGEARLVEWNLAPTERATLLYEVDAAADALRARLGNSEAVATADVARIDDGQCWLLLTLRPSVTPVLREALRTLVRPGLVVLKPVVYRDGEVNARLVGESDAIQAAIDGFPAAVDVTVRAIGASGSPQWTPLGALSDRQRAAVEAALELGYYEHPREATRADVGEAIDCAASTAAEHLQKAEAKLFAAMADEFRTSSAPGSNES